MDAYFCQPLRTFGTAVFALGNGLAQKSLLSGSPILMPIDEVKGLNSPPFGNHRMTALAGTARIGGIFQFQAHSNP
jgi:hypothetical protein